MKKRLYSVICIAVMLCNIFGSMCVASATEDIVKYNYKIGMDSHASFTSMYGYNGGTHKFKKSYVAGKYGKAIELNYPGHYISNAGNRYNGYVFEFLTDDVENSYEIGQKLKITFFSRKIKVSGRIVYINHISEDKMKIGMVLSPSAELNEIKEIIDKIL